MNNTGGSHELKNNPQKTTHPQNNLFFKSDWKAGNSEIAVVLSKVKMRSWRRKKVDQNNLLLRKDQQVTEKGRSFEIQTVM